MNKCVYLFILLVACNKLYGQAIYTAKALSLPDAIEIGLKNNPEMGIAAAQIKAVEGKFWTGISLPQPEFSVGYDFVPTGKSLNNYSERTIGISQAIEFPSTYFLRGTKLSKEKEIASLQFKVTQLGVISRIKSAYVILAANHEYIKIASENLAIAEDFADKADIRYNAGEGTNLERLTAKVQYAEATNNEELHKNQLLAALAEFNFALGYGKDADRKYMLTDTLSYRAFNMPLEKLIGEAMGTSPQLNIAELHVRSSVLDKTLAWTSLLPSFNLAYFKQYRDGNSGYYGASLGIAIPLWGLFDQRGKIAETSANIAISESELQVARNTIYLKIQSAYSDLKNAEKQVQLYHAVILPQSEEIYRSATMGYDAGEITYIEFLQAKQTIINSKSSYINALLMYNLSVIALEEAMGKSSN